MTTPGELPVDSRDHHLLQVAEVRARRQLAVIVLIGAAGAVLLLAVTVRAVDAGAPAALFALPAMYLIPLAFGVLVQARMRHRRPEWMGSPVRVNGLDRATRRQVMSAVRHGRLPENPYERELAREFAASTLRTRWLYWAFGLMAAVFAADGILVEGTLSRALLLLGAALSALAWAAGLILVRGARSALHS